MYIKSYNNKGQKKYKARFRGLEFEGMGSGFFFFFEREQGYTFLNEHHFKRCLNKTREKNLPAEETYVPRPSKRSILAIFEEEHGDQSGWSSRCRRGVGREMVRDVAGTITSNLVHNKNFPFYSE